MASYVMASVLQPAQPDVSLRDLQTMACLTAITADANSLAQRVRQADVVAARGNLMRLRPAAPAMELLDYCTRPLRGPDIRRNAQDLDDRQLFERFNACAFQAGLDLDADEVRDAVRQVGRSIAVQQALVESWCSWLESGEVSGAAFDPVSGRVRELQRPTVARLLAFDVDDQVLESTFVTRPVLDWLREAGATLHGEIAQQLYAGKMHILERNCARHETLCGSPVGALPALAGVSREFQVDMFERLMGWPSQAGSGSREALREYASRPRRQHADGATHEHRRHEAAMADLLREFPSLTQRMDSLRVPGGRPTPVAEPSLQSTSLQSLLLQAGAPGAPAMFWHQCCERLANEATFGQASSVFVDAQTLTTLKQKLSEGSWLTEHRSAVHTSKLLGVLQRNSRRFAYFMASPLSDNPAFHDVDRCLLVPWSELVSPVLDSLAGAPAGPAQTADPKRRSRDASCWPPAGEDASLQDLAQEQMTRHADRPVRPPALEAQPEAFHLPAGRFNTFARQTGPKIES